MTDINELRNLLDDVDGDRRCRDRMSTQEAWEHLAEEEGMIGDIARLWLEAQ
jgi:hypothetical protein